MLRLFVVSAIALLLSVGAGWADDAKDKGKGKDKGARTHGVVKKYDPRTGTLTVTVKSKEDKSGNDEEFKVAGYTQVTTFGSTPDDKTDGIGGAALKDVKPGTRVAVMHADGKAKTVLVNPMKKKANK